MSELEVALEMDRTFSYLCYNPITYNNPGITVIANACSCFPPFPAEFILSIMCCELNKVMSHCFSKSSYDSIKGLPGSKIYKILGLSNLIFYSLSSFLSNPASPMSLLWLISGSRYMFPLLRIPFRLLATLFTHLLQAHFLQIFTDLLLSQRGFSRW